MEVRIMQVCEVTDYNVWLGSRIKEIMEDKKITVRGLAKEIDIGRMTLERILDGRYATADELEKIAKGLGCTVDRIKMKDTRLLTNELDELLRSKRNPWRAHHLAEFLLNIAVGRTEQTDAYLKLGHTLYNLRRYEEAFEAWRTALRLVQNTDDRIRINRACNNLLTAYIKQGRYAAMESLLNEVEDLFRDDVEMMGRYHHFWAILASNLGQHALVQKHYLKSYQFYKQTRKDHLIGHLYHDQAHYEYMEGNYAEAKRLLERAKELIPRDSEYMHVSINQAIARTLIMMGEKEEALEIIEKQLALIRSSEFEMSELEGKFWLMKAYIKDDVTSAEKIMELKVISRELKLNAVDFLTESYMRRGDLHSAQKYYQFLKENLPEKIPNFRKGYWF
jgi:tetratricopeptide (TPR) repeat protein/DNA-binding Xre family transcriptional regulator